MSSEPTKSIPTPVVKRLINYLNYIIKIRDMGTEWCSSVDIAEALSLTSSTVRQDLSYLDFSGISKKGYATDGLAKTLVQVLGVDKKSKVIVIGAGRLGKSLALHDDFPRRGFDICGIFDCDPKKVGKKVGTLKIQDVKKLSSFIKSHDIHIGIIAVPAQQAQNIADQLVEAPVKGVLNFTIYPVTVPENISLVDARIVSSLMELTHSIQEKKAGKAS